MSPAGFWRDLIGWLGDSEGELAQCQQVMRGMRWEQVFNDLKQCCLKILKNYFYNPGQAVSFTQILDDHSDGNVIDFIHHKLISHV